MRSTRRFPHLPLAPRDAWSRSFESFFGPHVVADTFAIDGRGEDGEIFWQAPVDARPYAFLAGGYSIHVTPADEDWDPPTAHLVTAGEAVGFYGGGELWIDPGHRGKGLGAELVLAMTDTLGSCPSRANGPMGFSVAGAKAHRKAWELACGRKGISMEPSPDAPSRRP